MKLYVIEIALCTKSERGIKCLFLDLYTLSLVGEIDHNCKAVPTLYFVLVACPAHAPQRGRVEALHP